MWTAEHEGRAHRWPATSGAVPVQLKVAEVTAVHPAVALVRLALLLQHHAPPFRSRVLEPDLGTRPAQGSARCYVTCRVVYTTQVRVTRYDELTADYVEKFLDNKKLFVA